MVAAGVLTPEDSARVMAKRGEAMHQASLQTKSGLIIPLGFNRQEAEDVCAETAILMKKYSETPLSAIMETEKYGGPFKFIANAQEVTPDKLWEMIQADHFISLALVNEPTVNVLGGTKIALDFAIQVALRNGARRVLEVDAEGAFHTEAMRLAADEFSISFREVPLHEARFGVVLNIGTETTDLDKMREAHIAEMTEPVNWVRVMEGFRNIQTVVKIGPNGQVPGVSEANGIPNERQINIVSFLSAS